MRIPILTTAAVLGVLWLALPVRLPNPLIASSSEECLTLPDTPPDPGRTDRLPIYEHCSQLNPDDVEVLADLGWLYEAADRGADAEAVYTRALALDAGYAELRLRLGRLLLKRGEAAAAQQEAEAGLDVQPNRQALLDLLRDARGRE